MKWVFRMLQIYRPYRVENMGYSECYKYAAPTGLKIWGIPNATNMPPLRG